MYVPTHKLETEIFLIDSIRDRSQEKVNRPSIKHQNQIYSVKRIIGENSVFVGLFKVMITILKKMCSHVRTIYSIESTLSLFLQNGHFQDLKLRKIAQIWHFLVQIFMTNFGSH